VLATASVLLSRKGGTKQIHKTNLYLSNSKFKAIQNTQVFPLS